MVAIDVRMRRVDAGGREVANVLLDDPVHLHVRERVEAHVRKVEVDVVGHAELGGCAQCLVLLARADLGIARILRRRAVGDDDDPHLVTAIGVHGDRPTHPEHLVVGVRGENQNPAHRPTPVGR